MIGKKKIKIENKKCLYIYTEDWINYLWNVYDSWLHINNFTRLKGLIFHICVVTYTIISDDNYKTRMIQNYESLFSKITTEWPLSSGISPVTS